MADSMSEFEEQLKNVANSSERFDRSMGHAQLSMGRIISAFVSADLVKRAIDFGIAQSKTITMVKAGFAGMSASSTELLKKQKTLNSDMRELLAFAQERIDLGDATVEEINLERAALLRQQDVLKQQVRTKQLLASFHPAEMIAYATILGSAGALYRTHRITNTALIEANSSMRTRVSLTRDVLRVQQQLGSELEVTRDAASALVGYGYDLEKGFAGALQLVVQMHDGLGLSVSAASELYAVYDRQLKTPVREVADAMARVVNDTALAADQAARMATNIGRAVALLRPGSRRDVGAVNELIGQYEGALVKLGGQFGAFQEMLTRMTTPEGLSQAGILGVTNPEFLGSREAAKQVVDSFVAYAKQTIGNSSGWDRALRLQIIADQFGVTAQQANLMIQAVENANSANKAALTLSERYEQQVRASAKSFHNLGNSLSSLLQQAVMPLLPALAWATNRLAGFVEALVRAKAGIYVVGTAMVGTMVVMVPRIWSAVRAFTALTAALVASARAANASALAQAATGGLSGLGGAGRFSLASTRAALKGAVDALKHSNKMWFLFQATNAQRGLMLSGLRTGLIPLGHVITSAIIQGTGVLAAAVAGWKLGEWINNAIQKTFIDKYKSSSVLKVSYDDSLKAALHRFAAKGDTASITRALHGAERVYRGRGDTEVQARLKIVEAWKNISEEVGNLRFRKEMAQSSIERDPQLSQDSATLAVSQAELIRIAEEQRNAALEQIVIQREQLRKDKERQEEEIRNYRLRQGYQFQFTP